VSAVADLPGSNSRQRALKVLDVHVDTFGRLFGLLPFALHHRLASSGLFTQDRLAATAQKLIDTRPEGRFVFFQAGNKTSGKFADMRRQKPFAAALEQLQTSSCWLKLTDVGEVDPELDEVYWQTVEDAEALLGVPIREHIRHGRMTVFMASPHVVTPYHIDHDHNFLCQIASEKTVWLWDPADRQTLSEREIERFYFGNTAAAQYRSEVQSRAHEFRLTPGDAVYHPPLAPHLVKNGPDVSISVSIAFSDAALDRRARIYQANWILRKFGMKPAPPGRSRVFDQLRSGAIGLLNKRKPKNYDEAVFSGIKRVKAPFEMAQKIIGHPRARSH
jgi:hypothetical protein